MEDLQGSVVVAPHDEPSRRLVHDADGGQDTAVTADLLYKDAACSTTQRGNEKVFKAAASCSLEQIK